MRSRSLRALVVLLAVLFLAAMSFIYIFPRDHKNGVLRVSGTIEATNVDVSFQIGGRVLEVMAREGQFVKANDLLARMSSEEITGLVKQTEASLETVESQARQQAATVDMQQSVVERQIEQAMHEAEATEIAAARLHEGSRPQEIRVAEAEVQRAEAEFERQSVDFQRMTTLRASDVISQQVFDAARSATRSAESNLAAARERLNLLKQGPRREDIAEAEARLRAARSGVQIAESGRKGVEVQRLALESALARKRELKAQLDVAKTQLGYTEIRTPLDGVIVTRNVESGEVVNPGTPVVTVANIDELWMNVYVPEAQTGRVKLGQAVLIHVDSFPGEEFKGKVTFISSESEFTPKTIQTEEERVKLVYRVKVSLENTGQRLKPGMPADAEILP